MRSAFRRSSWLLPLLALATPLVAAPASAPAAQAPAEPRPALWLLADADTRIYLFGTIHMLPPNFRWRSAALDKAVAEAGELVVETYVEPGKEDEAFAGDAWQMMLPKPVPILSRVPRKYRRTVKRALKASSLPIEAYDVLETWAAAFMLGMSQQLGVMGTSDPNEAPGVEDALEEQFRTAKKPIGSVETGDDVARGLFGHFRSLSQAEQAEMLVGAAEGQSELAEVTVEDNQKWVTGDAEGMAISEGEDFPPPMYDILIRRRNAAWTVWLADRLKRPGTVLFAVGAGHLAGPDAVQRMLKNRGLQAVRVN